MGQHRIKNIVEPVEVWRVALDAAAPRPRKRRTTAGPKLAFAAAAVTLVLAGSGFAVWKWTMAPVLSAANSSDLDVLAMPTGPSIAVLPFDSYSRDPEQEYFADGIVEDILTR